MSIRAHNPLESPSGDVSVSLTLRPSLLPVRITRDDAREQPPSADHIVTRVRGEFLEMPGLSPTLSQAARLFALSTTECERVLALLVDSAFLRCGVDGHYRLTARR